MENIWQDIRFAIRMLAKNPGFAAIAVVTLALGIGANTSIFTVVNAEMLRPLPFHDPSRLVTVFETSSRSNQKSSAVSYANFADWRAQNQVFEKIAVFEPGSATLTGVDKPAHIQSAMVSADLFPLLGATPEIGRQFTTEEDTAHHHLVMLSDHFWRQQFGSDPGIIGRPITLDSVVHTVVGVMPPEFAFPLQRVPVDAWTTVSMLEESSDGSPPMSENHGAHFLHSIARLKQGVSLAQAQSAMDVIANGLAKQYPNSNK